MRIIELDIDGVFADCLSGVNARVHKHFPQLDFDIYSETDYNFSQYSENVREHIYACFSDPLYMRSLPLLPNAEECIARLLQLEKEGRVLLRVNTLTYSAEVQRVRREWVLQHFQGMRLEPIVQIGKKKEMLDNVFCTFEDSIDNLVRANSQEKYLIATNSNVGVIIPRGVKRVGLLEAVELLEVGLSQV